MSSPEEPDRPWLDPSLLTTLEPMLELLAASPVSLSSVTDPVRARDVHLSDSLSGLAIDELAGARKIVDIGSGAGFPGIPIGVAMPRATVDLLDSVGRKVEFMETVIETLGLSNTRAIRARSEDWAAGEGAVAYDVATARAVAPLEVLAEFGSPLLEENGSLVAWKGEREPEAEARLVALRSRLAMDLDRVVPVVPFTGSRERNLYVLKKTGPTPEGLPRRPGMARKRPLPG